MSEINDLTFRRRAEVIDLAEFIAMEYAANGRIEPGFVASEKDIPIIYKRYGHYFDGMLMFSADRFFIYCNLDKAGGKDTPRARFTIAHELGHFFLDEHRRVLLSGKNLHHGSLCEYASKRIVEQEADLFASYLLMPTMLFDAQIRRKKPKTGIEEVLYLKEIFGTSIMSTAIRLVNAEIMPCSIFIWNNDGSLKWHWKSSAFVKDFIGRPIQSTQTLRGAATTQAFRSMDDICHSGATVADFFENVPHSSTKNALVHEEALRLGEHGVLTMIFTDGASVDYSAFGGSR
jgi:Zn-dependent peptidase ImmA (M78 family)